MIVAVDDQGVADIEHEHQLYIKYGHNAVQLSREELQHQINSPLFKRGLWSKKRSGTINPAKMAWGLKRVAKELGVIFYENTPMMSSTEKDERLLVKTPKGSVVANKVILATNAFTKHKRKISTRVAAIRDRIVMTEPLTLKQLSQLGWQNRQGIFDTRTQLNYMRLTKDNRVLFGGRIGYFLTTILILISTKPQHRIFR